MICPKCGRNTPGNVCPYCEGPQIQDNTDDYNRRRKAFEDLTGEREYASESMQDDAEKEEKKPGYRKIIIPITIAAAAGVAAIVAVNAVRNYRPAPEYNSDVFYASNGKFYRMSGADPVELGEEKNIFFNGDGSRFYRSDAIEELVSSKGYLTDTTMSDDTGNIYACSLYDPNVDTDNYKLFIWKKDGEPVEKLSSGGMIGIKYISDSGRIFYTKTDVITEELGTGSTSLWCFDFETDKAEKLEENIDSVYFYTKTDSVIIRNKDDVLCKRGLTDIAGRTKITEGVSELLPEDGMCNNFFKASDGFVNSSDTADRLCFVKSGRMYMYELTTGESVNTGSAKGSDIRACFDDINKVFYTADSSGISCCITDAGKAKDVRSLDKTGAPGSFIWNDYKKCGLYLTSGGELKRVSDRKIFDMSEGNEISKLTHVQNDGGYAYVKDKAFRYASSFDKNTLSMGEVTYGKLYEAVRGGEYIYRLEGKNVIAVSEDGSYTKDMGACERLWCGKL